MQDFCRIEDNRQRFPYGVLYLHRETLRVKEVSWIGGVRRERLVGYARFRFGSSSLRDADSRSDSFVRDADGHIAIFEERI